MSETFSEIRYLRKSTPMCPFSGRFWKMCSPQTGRWPREVRDPGSRGDDGVGVDSACDSSRRTWARYKAHLVLCNTFFDSHLPRQLKEAWYLFLKNPWVKNPWIWFNQKKCIWILFSVTQVFPRPPGDFVKTTKFWGRAGGIKVTKKLGQWTDGQI